MCSIPVIEHVKNTLIRRGVVRSVVSCRILVIHVCKYMYICMCVCVYVYARAHTHTYTHTTHTIRILGVAEEEGFRV